MKHLAWPALSIAAVLLLGCATPSEPPAAFPLAGSSWLRTDDMDAAPHFATIDFSTAGASGFAGCNTWHAAIRADTHALRFGSIATTRIMCPQSSMQTEHNFLPVLARTRGFRLEGEELVFVNGAGAVVARFTCATDACPQGAN